MALDIYYFHGLWLLVYNSYYLVWDKFVSRANGVGKGISVCLCLLFL